jgi:hypothetical protein
MKTIKQTLLAIALCAFALTSTQAAVVHDTVLSGYDYENVTIYDAEYNVIGEYTSYYWEVDALVYDDQPGEVRISWWTPTGVVYIRYEVAANATSWWIVEGTDLLSFSAASTAMFNLLIPPPSW